MKLDFVLRELEIVNIQNLLVFCIELINCDKKFEDIDKKTLKVLTVNNHAYINAK